MELNNQLIQVNLFSALDDQEKIFFCKTDFLDSAFNKIKNINHDVILITGNSDYEINDNTINQSPKNIKYWFAQNANSDNVFGIPIGLENSIECKVDGHGRAWEQAIPKHKYISTVKSKIPSRHVYANFSISTNPSQRSSVADICRSSAHITSDIILNHNEINKRKYSNYIDEILDHKMVVCPEGNGVDCHRTWETLLLNRVPIVKKSKVMNHFSDLPILYVDEWSQIRDLKLIIEKYKLIKDNAVKKLDFKYWKSLILLYKSKLTNYE